MTKMQTNSPATTREQRHDDLQPALSGAWDPLRAWRWHCLYSPLSEAVRATVGRVDGEAAPVRVLEVGGAPGVLQGLLERVGGATTFAVRRVDTDDDLSFDEGLFDCVVAVDWLPLVPPSRRETAVADLARLARSGLILANAFHSPEAVAAERYLNAAHVSARGVDHPQFSRHLELGLPDIDAVRGWLGGKFKHVVARGLEDIAVWRAAESLALLTTSEPRDATAGDLAATALFPPVGFAREDAPAYRSVLVASVREPRLTSDAASPAIGSSPEIATLLVHQAVEAAAQRRAFDRLADMIVSEREREREEFRATAQSMAAELRDREANAEFLAREIRRRDELVGDQQTAIVELDKRVRDTMVHARNMEAQAEIARQAASAEAAVHRREVEQYLAKIHEYADQIQKLTTRVTETDAHVANLEDLAKHWQQHAHNLEQVVQNREAHAAAVEAQLGDATERAAQAERALAALQAEYDGWRGSRGGRTLTRYVKLKRTILGRKD